MAGTLKHKILQGSITLVMATALPLAAWASGNTLSQAEIEKKYHATFQEMLANPGSIDATMRYAKLAIDMKDYEAAIPALERILMFNPNLPETKLELGVLYYNLESYDVSRAYFEDAKKTKGASSEVAAKADNYLSRM